MAFAFDNLTSLVKDQTCVTFNKVLGTTPGNFPAPKVVSKDFLSIGELKNGLLGCHKVFLPQRTLAGFVNDVQKETSQVQLFGSTSWELWMVQVQENPLKTSIHVERN